MLEDVKFDLQTLDFRALPETGWAELKTRLERRARLERNHAFREAAGTGWQGLRRLAGAATAVLGAAVDRLGSAMMHAVAAHLQERRRRNAVSELNSLDDRMLKDMGVRRCEIYSVVYRHDASRLR